MQKIIFINRFFFPDHSATSQILTDLVHKLSTENSDIHIITSRLIYDNPAASLAPYEVIKNVHIHRCWTSRFGRGRLVGRAIDYLTFYITSLYLLLRLTKKNDVVIAKTDPPLISVLAALVVKIKKARLINWLQDLFPEVAKELGVSFLKGRVFEFVKKIRNWSLRVADFNVVLGEIMAEKVNNEVNKPDTTVVIPNWVIGKQMAPVLRDNNSIRKEWKLEDKFVIGYSGNLGRAHDYQTILRVAIELKDNKDIVFVFIGGGAGYDLLMDQAEQNELSNMLFKPYQASDVLAESLSVPDVHLISLEPSLEGLIVPSKFYGIISVGRPVIYIGDCDGEIARLLQKFKCGLTVSIGDVDSLMSGIKQLETSTSDLEMFSQNSRKMYEEKFRVEISISAWERILKLRPAS